ncbi:transcription termination/antitermination NusG family protein [Sinorhizobium sp. 7-81]|uniref:transcription termination/antitermination protein NusG n=1 Tax=Sinorhizobium sp. 8-89 TaxID=3049089 RepID=UPI0024C2529A|nr:transcription termination/antitermination NusG family protein [Sinorhizobium sp. 8-89]MDK1494009.1 transcription termination/antitermination NusG family protein [Sinorhizobium sp. 8-89]
MVQSGDWYVVRTRAGQQQKAVQEMQEKGIEAYCPTMRRETRHHQTKKWIMREFPLFTGYAFAPLTPWDFATLRDIRNVVSVLGDADGNPAPVSWSVIEQIKDAQERGDFDVLRPPVRRLKAGDSVQIKDGPLSGHYAAVTNVVGRRAIKAFVEMFGSLREVEIALESIRRVA